MATVNQSLLRKVVRAYKELSKNEEMFDLSLVDDKVDSWEIKLKYSENRCVILRCQFYLADFLPPKATVLFPSSISYVCFEGALYSRVLSRVYTQRLCVRRFSALALLYFRDIPLKMRNVLFLVILAD
jgi:hypothetical protein